MHVQIQWTTCLYTGGPDTVNHMSVNNLYENQIIISNSLVIASFWLSEIFLYLFFFVSWLSTTSDINGKWRIFFCHIQCSFLRRHLFQFSCWTTRFSTFVAVCWKVKIFFKPNTHTHARTTPHFFFCFEQYVSTIMLACMLLVPKMDNLELKYSSMATLLLLWW